MLIEYDVLANGTTAEIGVVSRIGHPVFERSAVRAMKGWRFAPAMKDGVAIASRDRRVVFPFKIRAEFGAKPEAARALRRAFQAMAIRDVAEARAVLEELEAWKWPNLYEDQYRSLVRGLVAYLEDRIESAIRSFEKSMLYDGKYIGHEGRLAALVWTVRAAHLAELDGTAYHAAHLLVTLAADRAPPRDIAQILTELEARRVGGELIGRAREVPVPQSTYQSPRVDYRPLRRTLRLEPEGDGFPDRIRIDCDGHEEDRPASAGETIALPEEWGSCELEIYAAAGTRFSVIEPPPR